MLLTLDIGNTIINLGCFEGDDLRVTARITTEKTKTEDQYAVAIRDVLDIYGVSMQEITGAILSSVVPTLTGRVAKAVEKIARVRPLVVGPGIKTGLNIKIDDPATLGADLVADCVSALAAYPLPCIVLDMGTATSFTVLNEKGVMVGGAILPGVQTALDALCRDTALLTNIALVTPAHAIGKNTAECMASGSMLGTAAMIDGMVDRLEEELGSPCTLVGTGDLAGSILPLCRRKIIFDEHLLLNGLRLLYQKNTAPKQAKTVL